MLVKIYSSVNDFIEFKTELKDTREIFNSIKHTLGEDVTDKILYSEHLFLGTVGDKIDVLTPTTIYSDINLYEELHIVPVIEGELPIIPLLAAWAATAGGIAATAIGSASVALGLGTLSAGMATFIIGAVGAIVQLGVTMGISMAVSAIMTPDSSFGSDPAKAQKQSKMFNTALTITEQGGSVPLTYGNPFCGGVLISSGITSSDIGVKVI
jgi:predicted phage tail protein